MDMSTPPGKPRFCASCGAPLSAEARFCTNCGTQTNTGAAAESTFTGQTAPAGAASTGTPAAPPQPPSGAARQPGCSPAFTGTAQPAAAPPEPPPRPGVSPPFETKVFLVSPGLYRARVQLALRQFLGVNPSDAAAYVAAAPVLLAVGLAPDVMERLRAVLVGAGAVVRVESPPPPPPPREVRPPKPEPHRSRLSQTRLLREIPSCRGVRTVTGLCLGHGCSYLTYSRVEGDRLVTPPDFVRFEGRTMVPSAIRPAGGGIPVAIGFEALSLWPSSPEEVQLDFMGELGEDDVRAGDALRSYLKALAFRLSQVLGSGALNRSEGASTNLAVPVDWTDEQVRQLAEFVEQAGFPLTRIVPEPLAAVLHHCGSRTMEPADGPIHTMVVDWGSQGLGVSFIESGITGSDAAVFDHLELPLGGIWFDMLMEEWLYRKLQTDLTDEDHRALALFARHFKEEASRTFSSGRSEHVQYCVVPAGMPPTRMTFSRTEADELFGDAFNQFREALTAALDRVGFQPAHVDQVLVAGGGARWYFVREIVRSALNCVPLIAHNPDETIPLGLAAC